MDYIELKINDLKKQIQKDPDRGTPFYLTEILNLMLTMRETHVEEIAQINRSDDYDW